MIIARVIDWNTPHIFIDGTSSGGIGKKTTFTSITQ